MTILAQHRLSVFEHESSRTSDHDSHQPTQRGTWSRYESNRDLVAARAFRQALNLPSASDRGERRKILISHAPDVLTAPCETGSRWSRSIEPANGGSEAGGAIFATITAARMSGELLQLFSAISTRSGEHTAAENKTTHSNSIHLRYSARFTASRHSTLPRQRS